MDTTHRENGLMKEAGPVTEALNLLGRGVTDIYLPLALLGGTIVGSTAGLGASMLKARDPKIVEINRKKKFYESKIDEMENENWLNEIISIRKKLETGRLTDNERKSLESRYVDLINK